MILNFAQNVDIFWKNQGSDARKPSDNERKEDRGENEEDKGSEEGDEQEQKDDKNVVFCMWGHENCKTRWDYIEVHFSETKGPLLLHYTFL